MNDRLALLDQWLRSDLGFKDFTLESASEDASFRRYFRVRRGSESLIVMDAPPDREDCGPYIDVAGRLSACGVHVPEIMELDLNLGFLLLGDLGDVLYLDVLTDANADDLYGDAMDALLKMQVKAAVDGLPPYGEPLLMQEMELFRNWLLDRHLKLKPDPAREQLLDEVFLFLKNSALEQPRVFVHRDYHSRNLLVNDANNPGIVDFQDAVYGPITYDLVSLLKDCYIKWPRSEVGDWLGKFYRGAAKQLRLGVGEEQYTRWFDFMGVQRQLKASGIFARLWHRDHKNGFLKDIPRTLSYVTDMESIYPELSPLIDLINTEVLPVLKGNGE